MKTSAVSVALPTVTPNLGVENNTLTFCGFNTEKLIQKYGSPLFVMSEDIIKQNCRHHKQLMEKYFDKKAHVAYASKAMSCRQIYRILQSEGMYADVVSSGELYTAVSAGFDASHLIFHGNNKTVDDIAYAINAGIGLFVADNVYELENISEAAKARGICQNILIRVTPGIDPHTHEKINTARIDSKFGSPISNGQAEQILKYALSLPGIRVVGIHYHIGSQITEAQPFCDAFDNILDFLRAMGDKLSFTADIINIGGGFGIRYIENDPSTPYDEIFRALSNKLYRFCSENSYEQPTVITEPGRSIVANAGITLYTVGAVKNIPGYKSYVSVDGGMTDNPRYTLYNAPYTAILANKADCVGNQKYSIVGRCCESGDILIPEASLPAAAPGDILAMLNTGAYNYSMASNYNRIPRPPIIMLNGDQDYVAVRRESFENLIMLDN